MTKLQLLTTKHFNDCALDCYIEPGQQDKGDFWATREQIGTLLEYADPVTAVKNIHLRNQERLDKFSTQLKLSQVEGGRTVTREVTVYSFKGLLEICRYSNQPKANAVMDWLFNVADEIRRTGNYSMKNGKQKVTPSLINSVTAVLKLAGLQGNQLALAVDKYFQSYTGHSALETAGIHLEVPEPRHNKREAQLWEHIVSTFAPDEWFSISELMQSLEEAPICIRQIRRYLLAFVANKQLKRRGDLKGTEYSRKRS